MLDMKKEELLTLMKLNRSCRRFDSSHPIDSKEIESWLAAVRYAPSAKNAQPLKYKIITEPDLCNNLFGLLHWAAYLPEFDGPNPHERPTAYLVQLLDKEISNSSRFDEGIQQLSLTLIARSEGYAACILAAFDASKMMQLLALDTNRYSPIAVIALGKEGEKVVIEDLAPTEDPHAIRYYRTPDEVHHVPKRGIAELLL